MAATHKYQDTDSPDLVIPTIHLLYSGSDGLVEGVTRVVSEDILWVGRDVSPRGGICLRGDTTASSKHAQIQLRTEPETGLHQVLVTDLGSTNGTFVNRTRQTRYALKDGDVIQVGSSFLLMRNEPVKSVDSLAPSLLGKSPAIRALRCELVRAAGTSHSVLLLGESGTGKELAAQTIHEQRRKGGRQGPFKTLNCAAVPEQLAESTFFGHKAGAFTEARTASDGYFRAAEGGTLFLDEIGELGPALQAKLLRALEEKRITPVGTTVSVPCDIHVVAATNRDLATAVASGDFRGDLFARLDAQRIHLPPLRERREDILPLIASFCGSQLPLMTARLVAELLLYRWPLNVRELLQFCRSMDGQAEPGQAWDLNQHVRLKLGLQSKRDAGHHGLDGAARQAASDPHQSPVAQPLPRRKKGAPPPVSREKLAQSLEQHGGNITRVSVVFDVDQHTVRRWMEYHGLRGEKAA